MNPRLEKIRARLKKRLDRTHGTIKIRELIAHSVKPRGEFDRHRASSSQDSQSTETQDSLINRMVAHISELTDIAATQHMEDSFIPLNYSPKPDPLLYAYHRAKLTSISKTPTLAEIQKAHDEITEANNHVIPDPNARNRITRLSFPEFSFYPEKKQGPLSITDFKMFLEKIEDAVKKYPPNIHLMLGTTPVRINEEVENVGIYVECGQTPIIRAFAKAVPSVSDPTYPKTRYRAYRKYYDGETPPSFVTAKTLNDRVTIQYGGNFICKTEGGLKFRMSVDICFDHAMSVAKNLVEAEIKRAKHKGEPPFPTLVSHLITSSSINFSDAATTAFITTHADASKGIRGLATRATTYISDSHVTIIDSLFGSVIQIDICPQHTLGSHVSPLAEKIKAHNEFSIALQALLVKKQHAITKLDRIDKEINKLLIQPVLQYLNVLNIKMNRKLVNNRHLLIQTLHDLKSNIELSTEYKNVFFSLVDDAIDRLETEEIETQKIKKQYPSRGTTTILSSVLAIDAPKSNAARIFESLTFDEVKIPNTTPILPATSTINSEPISANIDTTTLSSWLGVAAVAKYLSSFSSFTLPWNKKEKLSAADYELLDHHTQQLDTMEKRFMQAKESYVVEILYPKYFTDIEILLKKSRQQVSGILKEKTKTQADLTQLESYMEKLERLLPGTPVKSLLPSIMSGM